MTRKLHPLIPHQPSRREAPKSQYLMAVAPAFFWPTFLLSSIIFIVIFPMTYSMSEADALLNLKGSFANAQALNSWVADSLPCKAEAPWNGVVCYNGFVTGLRLGEMGLSGNINVDALLEIKGLRTLSLVNNSFSGSIPEFNRIGFLKALYLSGNQFSGEIPLDFFQKMGSLKKLWLSDNQFTGQIPSSLSHIPHLIELHLENNEFSGSIPNLDLSSLVEFNVSNNKLEGEIPPSLSKFSASSFAGNAGLCGEKLGKACQMTVDKPTSINNNSASNNNNGSDSNTSKITSVKIAAIVASSAVLILVVVFFIVRSRRKKENFDMLGRDTSEETAAVEVQVTAPVKKEAEPIQKTSSSGSSKRGSSHRKGGGGGVGELVMVNEEKGVFGLPDLMKASAEVLGNGGLGSSYKAMMANGVAVVVKRMREMNTLGKDGFDAEIRKLAKLRHWNILTPLGYHYRKDEKLVVFEYVPKGSLLYSLHGDRGPSHAELDWPIRLRIAQGIAEGMRYLHTELASSDLPHGNLKSSNILLGPDYEPILVDYGFSPLVNLAHLPQALFAYKAPEAVQYGRVSPKCDVYCLGVVILELLTGKFPSQYLNNGKGGTDIVQWVGSAISEGRESELLDPEIASSESSLSEMVQLIHIGAACTESNPEQRLDMLEAIRRIVDIKTEGGQGSRTIEVLPSLRDGYADSTHISNTEGHNEQSRRRLESNSFGRRSGHRDGDDFDFAPRN